MPRPALYLSRARLRNLFVVAFALGLFVCRGGEAQPVAPVPVPAFSPDPASPAAAAVPGGYALRLDAAQLEVAREHLLGNRPVRMALPVAPGVVVDIVFNELAPTGRGYALVGFLADRAQPAGEPPAEIVHLAVHGDVVAGDVVSRLGGWSISGVVGLEGVVVRPHASPPRDPAVSDAVIPRVPPVRSSHRPTWTDPPYEADLLVVVVRRALDELGGIRRTAAFVDNWVHQANRMLRNSGARTSIRLAGVLPARASDPYRADDSLGETLDHLGYTADTEFSDGTRPDPNGFYDWVHDAREEHRADLVHLVADRWRSGREQPCGRANLGSPGWDSREEPPASYPSLGYGISRHDCGTTTFAHELGHNFGLNHDRYEVDSSAREYSAKYPEWAYGLLDFDPAYVFGYVNQARFRRGSPGRRWPPARDAWLTVMSYDDQCDDYGFYCYVVPFFSNPRHNVYGDPRGIGGDRPSDRIDGPTDAVRVFNEFSRLVANNLPANCLRDGWKLNLQAWTGDFVRAEHGGGGRVIANRARPLVQETFTADADFPGCVEHGSVIALRTNDGSYIRASDGGGGPLDARGVRPAEWERFTIERVEEREGLVAPVDDIAIKSSGGHYVRVRYRDESPRPVRAEGRGRIGPWERFVVTVHRP